MPPTLEAAGLSRLFGRRRAVQNVSFALDAGEALALFGPNGAGKTTLLRLLTGLLRPSSGQAKIGGESSRSHGVARGMVGLISHQTMLYPALTALENVEFAARLHGIDSPRAAALHALETIGIADRAESFVKTLSRGMQQRVSIARAIVHRPSILLLDEPYTGLDAAGAAALTTMLRSLRKTGSTMVLVTHNIEEGLAIASHAGVMIRGELTQFVSRAGLDAAEFGAAYRRTVGATGASAA
jgi:heme exporter protein A